MKRSFSLSEQADNLDESSMIRYDITEDVLLAGQPEPEDWRRLVEAGFRTVVNIRSDPQRAAQQAVAAQAVGLRYVYLPLPAYMLEPEHLAAFVQTLRDPERGRVCIHCRTATRVALLWMLARMTQDGWTREQAEAELRAAGYDDDSMNTFAFCAEDYFERSELVRD
jgi:uncharacterized protein (TIGR01244 family)